MVDNLSYVKLNNEVRPCDPNNPKQPFEQHRPATHNIGANVTQKTFAIPTVTLPRISEAVFACAKIFFCERMMLAWNT